MRRKYIICFMACLCIVCLIGCSNQRTDRQEVEQLSTNSVTSRISNDNNKEHTDLVGVSIERIDNSIRNTNGQIIGSMYYDKPVLYGDSDAIEKINLFFEKESKAWLEGNADRLTWEQDDWMQEFVEDTEDMRGIYDDDVLVEAPTRYEFDAQIVLLNKEYFSVLQTVTWQTGGPSNRYFYGSTFDLKTGERVPFNTIIETNADTFRDMIVSFLIDEDMELELDTSVREDIAKIYSKRTDHSYITDYGDIEIQLNYEYFYDGKYIYIILNDGVFRNGGCVLKWNGLHGEKKELSVEWI